MAEDKSTTTLNDGTIVKWTINPNENNNYQNKLDEALLAQDSAAADDKIDIFLIEADYALKYVDSDYTLDVRGDIGLTDADLSGQYPYTQDIATAGGKLKGVTWQATPGLFAYRRSIAAPVVFYFMLQYMEGNLPMEIVEAARIDGSGEFSTFNRIVLPILKPALAVQAIFTFVNTWNNYFTPALVLSSSGKKTLPILIAQLRSADFLKFDMGQVYMMVAIAILPVIAVYLCLSKFIVRGVALGGVKG